MTVCHPLFPARAFRIVNWQARYLICKIIAVISQRPMYSDFAKHIHFYNLTHNAPDHWPGAVEHSSGAGHPVHVNAVVMQYAPRPIWTGKFAGGVITRVVKICICCAKRSVATKAAVEWMSLVHLRLLVFPIPGHIRQFQVV